MQRDFRPVRPLTLILFRSNKSFDQRVGRLRVEGKGVFQRLQFGRFLQIVSFETLARGVKEFLQIF